MFPPWVTAQGSLSKSVRFLDLTNVTTLLLEAGADVNAQSSTNERPIIMAQTLNDVPLLQTLITAGAEINFQDAEGDPCISHLTDCVLGESPLHEASAYGAARNAEFLIERGADLTVREQQGRTPAEFICACRDFDERLAAPCFDNTCSEDDIRDLERVFRRVSNLFNDFAEPLCFRLRDERVLQTMK